MINLVKLNGAKTDLVLTGAVVDLLASAASLQFTLRLLAHRTLLHLHLFCGNLRPNENQLFLNREKRSREIQQNLLFIS